jgi:hypothetical protein
MTQAELSARHYKRKRKSISRKRKSRRAAAKQASGQEATRLRRARFEAALPSGEDGFDYRIGDCREKLADIADNSVALILTDPPYRDEAEPLWHWLAQFSKRALVPGGSLICYFGGARLNKLYRILDDAGLDHWWPAAMLHNSRHKMFGHGVLVNHKAILWYTKGPRRQGADGRLSMVPSVVSSMRDNTLHPWAQGDGGVQQWIYHLTEPGGTVVDPFCGTAEWGRITYEKGRRWIGCDIMAGGAATVVV